MIPSSHWLLNATEKRFGLAGDSFHITSDKTNSQHFYREHQSQPIGERKRAMILHRQGSEPVRRGVVTTFFSRSAGFDA